MKIDKQKMQQLAALSDAELWKNIRSVAASKGLSLPEKTPSHTELEKVRAVMLSDKVSIAGAMRIINEVRKGKGNG